MSEPANDDVLDVRGAMELLKLGRNAVYDGCARGQIPHRRIGKLLRFSRSSLLRWLDSTNHFPEDPIVDRMISCGCSQVAQERH